MMIRDLTATGLLLALTLLPLNAVAYVTPDDALDDETYTTRFFEPPPSTRTTQAQRDEQQRISAERRDAELAAVKPQPEPEEDETMHTAAPEEEQSELDKMIELIRLLQSESAAPSAPAANENPSNIDPVTARLLLRLQARQDAAARQSFIQNLLGGDGETLHSGAPLADTGPATVLVVLAVAGAIGETWRRVRKSENIVLSIGN